MWLIYNILFALGFTAMLPWFLVRMLRRGGYRAGFMQRLGCYDAALRQRLAARERVWVHAVSVGEVFVALRLMAELRALRPELAFVLTTTTSTGHRMADARLAPTDVLLYFPVDFPGVVRRVLRTLQPRALLLTEGEIWPNLIRLAKASAIPVLLINGRMSAASFRGYQRMRLFSRPILRSLDALLVQGETDRERLVQLGVVPERVVVTGTAKYDMAASGDTAGAARAWLDALGIPRNALIVLGGSTWPGEEAALLRAFSAIRREVPDVTLVLVPRHAERGAEVSHAIQQSGLSLARRSDAVSGSRADLPPAVVLVDSTGELLDFYACATVVFVGKSLLHHGGQNFIEPALLGKAVITGPHLENFPDVAADFQAAQAFIQVKDEAALETVLLDLLQHPDRREALGQRGQALVRSRQGVVRKTAEAVVRVLEDSDFHRRSQR